MKRFKDSNNKIVTAQKWNPFNWINKLKSMKPPASLGLVKLQSLDGKPDVPMLPNIKQDWNKVSSAIKLLEPTNDKTPMDKILSIGNSGLLGYPGFYLANQYLGSSINKFTGMPYLADQLMYMGIIYTTLHIARTQGKVNALKAGGGIYDKIKKIYEKEYVLKTYDDVPGSGFGGSFGTPSKTTTIPGKDTKKTLKQIADMILASGTDLEGDGINDGAWKISEKTYHFKNQADVDEINHMLTQLLKDEKLNTNLSTVAPLAALILPPAYAFTYRKSSNWSTNKQDEKLFGIPTGRSANPKPVNQQAIDKAEKEREEKQYELLKKRGLLPKQPSKSTTKFNKGGNK